MRLILANWQFYHHHWVWRYTTTSSSLGSDTTGHASLVESTGWGQLGWAARYKVSGLYLAKGENITSSSVAMRTNLIASYSLTWEEGGMKFIGSELIYLKLTTPASTTVESVQRLV